MQYVKKISSIIVLSVLLFQTLSSSIITLNYKIDTSSFIEKFCVNKDKPELHCNGQCHLMKQFKTTNPNKEDKTPNFQIVNELSIFLVSKEINIKHFPEKTQTLILFQQNFCEYYTKDIFHPPIII